MTQEQMYNAHVKTTRLHMVHLLEQFHTDPDYVEEIRRVWFNCGKALAVDLYA